MTRQLYVAEHCPSAPTVMLSEYFDQRAEELLAGAPQAYPGHTALADRAQAAKLRRTGRDEPLRPVAGPVLVHMQGPRDETMVCPCGHWADFLCDTPIGRGKTCDRPMCHCCRDQVGEDLDRCPYHVALGR